MKRHRVKFPAVLLSVAFLCSFLWLVPLASAGDPDFYEEQLDRGVRNTEPYSYVLEKKAASSDKPIEAYEEAVRYSPDTPAFYFRLARATMPDVFTATSYVIEGVAAYGKSFWWLLSLSSLIYISLIVSFLASMAIVALVRFPIAVPLLSHDIGERKANAAIPLVLIPLSFFGPVALLLGFLFVSGLYMGRANRLPVYLALIVVSASPYLIKGADTIFSASSPKLRAIVSVNEGRGNRLAIEALGGEKDFMSRFSRALALKRVSRYDEAIAGYESVIPEGKDGRAFTNLGNVYTAIGNTALAKEAYLKAEESGPSAALFYNMSRVYRDTFEYAKGDEYFKKAGEIDRDLVSRLAESSSRAPNRFVADETLTGKEFFRAVSADRKGLITPYAVSPQAVSGVSAGIFFLLALSGMIFGKRARRCSRCGEIFCERCATGPHKEDMCADCYRSIIKPVEETPKERVTKLLGLHEKKSRSRRLVRLLSFGPPGLAQMFADSVLGGFVYLWLFLFSITAVVLNPLVSTGLSDHSHCWLNPPLIGFALLLYLSSNMSVRRRLRKGWL